ncbi:hypothetical protein TNCV_3665881 [Trichonephila clavipes]|uniref:Uncharacterized protein n=1 Tax=Trichonephila clavipes TaxID=2585209 RepID=A0A8X6S0S1_TRICX|nr:hypothetical protein TNCV_3665881 [Trichonephila clavipes]
MGLPTPTVNELSGSVSGSDELSGSGSGSGTFTLLSPTNIKIHDELSGSGSGNFTLISPSNIKTNDILFTRLAFLKLWGAPPSSKR